MKFRLVEEKEFFGRNHKKDSLKQSNGANEASSSCADCSRVCASDLRLNTKGFPKRIDR